MSETIDLQKKAMDTLLATSRTFFIPISILTPVLKEAVASAYLCMRAIDEIEDHPQLPAEAKIHLLRSMSQILQKPFDESEWRKIVEPYKEKLPEVSLLIGDWIKLAPSTVTPTIMNATATMAQGMAKWVEKDWRIQTEADLDDYTYYVAGLVGVLLSNLWVWYDGTDTDRELAIGFGRGLQAVNILRNREEDLARGGVDYFPNRWEMDDMFLYARRNLALADAYCEQIKPGPILNFCKIPLALAHGTLKALESGATKLTRGEVMEIVGRVAETN